MRILDISPLITEASPVYPGDAPLSLSFVRSPEVCVGTLTMSAHLGAHVDAPQHLNRPGDVSEIDLKELIGSCQVIESIGNKVITAEDLPSKLYAQRVLIKTGFKMPGSWSEDFSYLSTDAVAFLIEQGVKVIGIDTPSIDPAEDEKLPSHVLAIDAGILILENLELSAVQAGEYELIALPLKIKGLEASPVRAVLIDQRSGESGSCI